MAIRREIWATSFDRHSFPRFPCPRCKRGHLRLRPNGLTITEPQYSKDERSHEAWDPDWIVNRFSALTQCDDTKCGEIAVLSGHTEVAEEYDDEEGPYMYEALRPQSFFPAPPIFEIPTEVPESICDLIQSSFSLYWLDRASCSNKIRISLEMVLDELHVPRKRKTKNGDFTDLTLHARIELFQAKDKPVGDSFMAIKMVGNLGSHNEVPPSFGTLLDVYELYEEALHEVFGKKSKKLAEIKRKLMKASRKKKI